MHADVAAVIAELDEHRSRFEAFCRALSPEQLDRPVPGSSWVVRNFIAHLATIDEPVERLFLRMQGDTTSASDDPARDIDRWNDQAVAERGDLGVDELFAEAAERRAALKAVMAGFTERHLAGSFRFGGDSKRRAADIEVLSYLRGWCKHDPMHVVDMMRALPELASPELDAWFDDPVIRGYQAAMNAD